MAVITNKAKAVVSAANLGPNFDLTQIIAIIQQVFQAISACNPTAPKVHQAISNPGPLQKISLRRTVRAHVPNVALRQTVEEGVLKVGKASSQADTSAMYEEAVGTKPK